MEAWQASIELHATEAAPIDKHLLSPNALWILYEPSDTSAIELI